MSPIFKPHHDSPMKTSFTLFDRLDDRCLGPGELRLVEGMQTSLTETVTVLSSRIRYLEDLVDTYRRELAEVTDIKISLRVKEIECHDLVRAKPQHALSMVAERRSAGFDMMVTVAPYITHQQSIYKAYNTSDLRMHDP